MTAVCDPPCVRFDLASLVREHQADVWRYLRFLGAVGTDVDDLTQETFLAVARSAMEIRSRAETNAYLRAVARNQLLQLRRKQKRQVSTVEMTAAEEVWAEFVPDGGSEDLLDALRLCCEALAGRAKDTVDRFYRDQQSREEIAAQLDMTADGVKTLLRRTRDSLRECIERRLRRDNDNHVMP